MCRGITKLGIPLRVQEALEPRQWKSGRGCWVLALVSLHAPLQHLADSGAKAWREAVLSSCCVTGLAPVSCQGSVHKASPNFDTAKPWTVVFLCFSVSFFFDAEFTFTHVSKGIHCHCEAVFP